MSAGTARAAARRGARATVAIPTTRFVVASHGCGMLAFVLRVYVRVFGRRTRTAGKSGISRITSDTSKAGELWSLSPLDALCRLLWPRCRPDVCDVKIPLPVERYAVGQLPACVPVVVSPSFKPACSASEAGKAMRTRSDYVEGVEASARGWGEGDVVIRKRLAVAGEGAPLSEDAKRKLDFTLAGCLSAKPHEVDVVGLDAEVRASMRTTRLRW
jgi:hypothetical protein